MTNKELKELQLKVAEATKIEHEELLELCSAYYNANEYLDNKHFSPVVLDAVSIFNMALENQIKAYIAKHFNIDLEKPYSVKGETGQGYKRISYRKESIGHLILDVNFFAEKKYIYHHKITNLINRIITCQVMKEDCSASKEKLNKYLKEYEEGLYKITITND